MAHAGRVAHAGGMRGAQRTRDSDPARLLDKVRSANGGRDVHLGGGPRTIETFRALGRPGLLIPPLLLGDGMRLPPWLSPDAGLVLDEARPLPGGTVEIVYAFG